MSADNWATCPACLKREKQDEAERLAKAQKAYGKVTPEKYLELIKEVKGLRGQLECDLRED